MKDIKLVGKKVFGVCFGIDGLLDLFGFELVVV